MPHLWLHAEEEAPRVGHWILRNGIPHSPYKVLLERLDELCEAFDIDQFHTSKEEHYHLVSHILDAYAELLHTVKAYNA